MSVRHFKRVINKLALMASYLDVSFNTFARNYLYNSIVWPSVNSWVDSQRMATRVSSPFTHGNTCVSSQYSNK